MIFLETWWPLLVFLGGLGIFIGICKRAIREDGLSSGWIAGQKVTEVRAEGRLVHQVTANGVVLYEDRDESKVRAIAAAVDQARGGDY